MDYQSVPQENGEQLKQAIASLASYVSRCAHFVSLLGLTGRATSDIYNGRGWCRLEKYAVRPSLNEHVQMYEHVKETDKLQKLPISFNSSSEANPLEGEFKEELDKFEIAPTLIEISANNINDPFDDKILKISQHIIVSAQNLLNQKKMKEIEEKIVFLEQNLGEEKAFINAVQDKQGIVMAKDIILRASKVSKNFQQQKITRLREMKLLVDSETRGLDKEVTSLAYQILEDDEAKNDSGSKEAIEEEKMRAEETARVVSYTSTSSCPKYCFVAMSYTAS